VNSWVAYPNRAGLTSHTAVADVNVVIARGQTESGVCAQCDVAIAGDVVTQRERSNGRVKSAVCVSEESPRANGRIAVCEVGLQHTSANTSVVVGRSVA
jgi:hypothetical protein